MEIRPQYSEIGLFFFNDTATTEIYTLSLHDALPIYKDLITVDDIKYMPVYTKDLMTNREDAAKLKAAAKAEFSKKYPKVEVISTVVPQTDWNHFAITKKKITGYKRRAYVYILGRDGDDAFLHACYLFEAEREPGQEYVNAREYPQLQRVDAIPASVLSKIER